MVSPAVPSLLPELFSDSTLSQAPQAGAGKEGPAGGGPGTQRQVLLARCCWGHHDNRGLRMMGHQERPWPPGTKGRVTSLLFKGTGVPDSQEVQAVGYLAGLWQGHPGQGGVQDTELKMPAEAIILRPGSLWAVPRDVRRWPAQSRQVREWTPTGCPLGPGQDSGGPFLEG